MLTNLHIKHYAIIDELQLDFHKGMTCLTGETGAGKSILLGALGLVLGERAESHSVKHGHDKADISAVFNIEQLKELKQQLQELDLDSDNECILRRVIRPENGSKAYINGHPVTVATLKNVGNQLVNIHGQHAHQALLSKTTQRQRLDDSAQNPQRLEDVRLAFLAWQQAEQLLAELKSAQNQQSEKRALLDFQLDTFEKLAIVDGEWTQIQSEHQVMANSERIVNTLSDALAQLSDTDSSSAQATTTILSKHIHALEGVCELDERLTPALQALQSALIDTEEACTSLRNYQDTLDLDPGRLAFLDERMGALHGLAKKHHIEPEQLYSHHQTLLAESESLDNAEHNIDELSQNSVKLLKDYIEKSNKLHKLREKTSSNISLEVTSAMQTLGMEGGQFDIRITHTPDQFTEYGQDSIEFLVSANPGQPLQAISKVASGGELSRISLAIQMITAQSEPVPTLIFDEVDAGIGGGVAEIVGKHLRALSEHPKREHTERQVLCVTHLAQVASQAHQHLKVAKEKSASETTTKVAPLNTSERVQEIARMLGGSQLSKATLAHAQDMLQNSQI